MNVLEVLQYEWAIRALIASSMVGIMCGLLGVFIVLRNMSLIGDALSHAILPGVVVGFVVAGYSLWGFFAGAVMAGLIAAVIITWIQQTVKTKNDAAIGIVFTAMFSLGVMGISRISRNDGVHLDLKDFLFGNVLGVSDSDLYLTFGVMVFVMASLIVGYRYLFATTFQEVVAATMGISVRAVHYFLMLLLSFAVVASLKTVGVILVVAMLITPAATALLLSQRLPVVLVLSAMIGLLSAVVGLLLAIALETTPGPAMAVTATLIYLLAVAFAPERGLVFRAIRRQNTRQKVAIEDTLKQALKLHEQQQLTRTALRDVLPFGEWALRQHLRVLQQRGWLHFHGDELVLTGRGITQANKLVRAHRLWETYLVERVGLDDSQIHDDAEHYEHLLTDELMDEMEHHLGYPTVDPHGSPIPQKDSPQRLTLSQVSKGESATIASDQPDEHTTAELWKLGLLPHTALWVMGMRNNCIRIRQQNKAIEVPLSLASTVNVDVTHTAPHLTTEA